MNKSQQWNEQDPLGLKDLPLLEPDKDGWLAIRQVLEERQLNARRWKWAGGAMALAASLVLVVGLTVNQRGQQPKNPVPAGAQDATQMADSTSSDQDNTVESLIAMSQTLEQHLRILRDETGAMPAESVVYAAELGDMIVQVDGALNFDPDSVDLWGQRVNLLLDLTQIYQQRWELEYGKMASL